METITTRIDYDSRSDVFNIIPIGCIHAGTEFCLEDMIKDKVQQVKSNPFNLWIGMGDYAEFITPKDKRFDGQVIADWVKKHDIASSEEDWVYELFAPIKDQCLGLIMGNHETYYHKFANHDVYGHLVERLGVKALGYSCFYKLKFTRLSGTGTTVTMHIEHGSGAAQTEGGKTMRIVKSMNAFDADLYLIGHLHDIKIVPITRLAMSDRDDKPLKEVSQIGVMTGCYFGTYQKADSPSYAEEKGYTPTNMGSPTIEIIPDKREITAYHRKKF